MKTSLTIYRQGRYGYGHAFEVEVELLPGGIYLAIVSGDVPQMRETTRYGGKEWEALRTLEWQSGSPLVLSLAEQIEARDAFLAIQDEWLRSRADLHRLLPV